MKTAPVTKSHAPKIQSSMESNVHVLTSSTRIWQQMSAKAVRLHVKGAIRKPVSFVRTISSLMKPGNVHHVSKTVKSVQMEKLATFVRKVSRIRLKAEQISAPK